MRGAAFSATRMLKQVGYVNGAPRISNVSTGINEIGYTEVNALASSTALRTKTLKGWFASNASINNGDRLIDNADGNKYLTCAVKHELVGGVIAFVGATLFRVSSICGLYRPVSTLDEFGRASSNTLSLITSDIWVMLNPLNIDTIEAPDAILDKDKIKMYMPADIEVFENDRLVTDTGEKFKVATFTRAEILGLNSVNIVPDSR